jgi:1-deoxy-D-xylulose-5-phosphate synthase
VALLSIGTRLADCLAAAETLAAHGLSTTVADARFAKPLDLELLARHATTRRAIVTLEEHQRAGGFGSAVLEAINAIPGVVARVKCLAIPDRYIDHKTSRAEQLAECGLDATGVERAVLQLLERARSERA